MGANHKQIKFITLQQIVVNIVSKVQFIKNQFLDLNLMAFSYGRVYVFFLSPVS